MNFKVTGINHLGLAAKDPARTRWFFCEVLGLPLLGEELVAEQKTNTIMISSFVTSAASPAGRLEILEPSPAGEGPVAAFLAKKGGGIHHVALTVTDVTAAVQHLLSKQIRMIDTTPRHGAHHTRIAFVHPESTGGILVELVEEQSA